MGPLTDVPIRMNGAASEQGLFTARRVLISGANSANEVIDSGADRRIYAIREGSEAP